jgi:hypothetical protein
VRIREIALDIGWILVLVLLVPVAIPLVALGLTCLLVQRLYAKARLQWQPSAA